MEWKDWQNIPFGERACLPSCSGIYVVADTNNFVWYVGQAVDLKNRWFGRSHHRYPQLIRSNRKLGHKIYWKTFPVNQLDEKERYYIDLFNPELNGCKVKTYLPKQPQVDREIKRLFKALNNPTMFFPVIRSIVAGVYEDEDGTHCILTITNLNDFKILENSATKRYSKTVREAWIECKSYCGKNEEQYNYKWIPTYSLKGQKFEFIEELNILTYLEQNSAAYSQYVSTIELFGVWVKVLKDLSLLDTLPLEEEYQFLSNGKKTLKDAAYLNYRKPLLKTIASEVAWLREYNA
jgi:GIY-YIG catalytic domain